MGFSYSPEARRAYIQARRYRDRLAIMRLNERHGYCPRCAETPAEILRKAELALEGQEIQFELERLKQAPYSQKTLGKLERVVQRLSDHMDAQEAFMVELKAQHEQLKNELKAQET